MGLSQKWWRADETVSTTSNLLFSGRLAHNSADRGYGTGSALPCRVSASAHASRVPAVVVIVCLPLTVSKAVLYAGLVLNKIDPQGAALIGFAGALTYLAVFLPALVLAEPFAIGASIWYTHRRSFGEPAGGLIVCWLAVIVHTMVLISYFRLGR